MNDCSDSLQKLIGSAFAFMGAQSTHEEELLTHNANAVGVRIDSEMDDATM
jgi:hypothetical protein